MVLCLTINILISGLLSEYDERQADAEKYTVSMLTERDDFLTADIKKSFLKSYAQLLKSLWISFI